MKVVKKINNNIAIGLDSKQNEVVLFGKGIGFEKIPYELKDLRKVDRTFYGIDSKFYSLINEIDPVILSLCAQMVDIMKSKVDVTFNPNLSIMIADHINFSVKRYKERKKIQFPYSYEIEEEYPEFNKIAFWMVKTVNKQLKVHLEKGEVSCIAMHMINAQEGKMDVKESISQKTNRILSSLTTVIEEHFQITIDKSGSNYYRFRHHIQYFVKRREDNGSFEEDNSKLLKDMIASYPDTYECVKKMKTYLDDEYKDCISDNELLYLMIHTNRLCLKEGL